MGTHVLVPVDTSSGAWKAFKHVLSQYPDEQITVLHVIDPGANMRSEKQHIEQQITERVHKICENADIETDRITIETESGKPSHTIVRYATDNDIDQIVMGSRGLSDMDKLLLGSVAETVVRRSPVPVNVIR